MELHKRDFVVIFDNPGKSVCQNTSSRKQASRPRRFLNIHPFRCVWAFQPTEITMPGTIYSNNNTYSFIYPVPYLLFNNAFALPKVTKVANFSHKRLVHLFLLSLSLSVLLSCQPTAHPLPPHCHYDDCIWVWRAFACLFSCSLSFITLLFS